MSKEEILNTFLLANIPEIITQEEFDDVKKAIKDLQQENKDLNQKYLNAVADYETTMSELQELRKQLEVKNIIARNWEVDCKRNISKVEEKETQQKKFIDYMNKTIEELECDDVDDEEIKGYLIQRIDTFKEILSKYKKIIGVEDE